MSRRIMLSVFALMVAGMTASAADLPLQSRLGAIFAEPAEAGIRANRKREYSAPIIAYNRLPNPIWARGGYYYGSAGGHFDGGAHLCRGPPLSARAPPIGGAS